MDAGGVLTALPTLLPPHPPNSKLQLALALAENLLAVVTGVQAAREDANQSTASAECGPDFPSSTQLPYQVLATYYRTVLEWTVASLLKLKPPKPPAGNGSTKEQPNAAQQGQLPAEHVAYATHLMGLWGLLRMLLERGRPVRAVLREGGVPGSLLPAAAQSLRWVMLPWGMFGAWLDVDPCALAGYRRGSTRRGAVAVTARAHCRDADASRCEHMRVHTIGAHAKKPVGGGARDTPVNPFLVTNSLPTALSRAALGCKK